MSNKVDLVEELDGVNAFVLSVKDGGNSITVSGWTFNRRRFKEGKLVLFRQKDGDETRYKITKTSFPSDPTDQYFMDCDFCPRENQQKE